MRTILPHHSLQLPAESVVEVPFWMVPPLVQRGMVTPLLPAAFRAAVRKEIEAGPSSFDLRTCCAHWYELAHRVNSLPGEDHGLGPLSLQTFAARYRRVVGGLWVAAGLALRSAGHARCTVCSQGRGGASRLGANGHVLAG